MKSNILVLGIIVFATYVTDGIGQELSADEIFRKVVQYYDPNDRWESFKGEMSIYVIQDKHDSPLAQSHDIFLDNQNNVYKTVHNHNDSIIVRGLNKDIPFWKINGKGAQEEDMPSWSFKEEATRRFKEHHTFHFSIPLALKSAGANPSHDVGTAEVHKQDAYVLKFDKIPGIKKDGWYHGPVELYVDKRDFSLIGAYLDIEFAGGITNYFMGEITIDVIKAPQMRVFYNMEDTTYRQTDVFYPRLLFRDVMAEK